MFSSAVRYNIDVVCKPSSRGELFYHHYNVSNKKGSGRLWGYTAVILAATRRQHGSNSELAQAQQRDCKGGRHAS